MGCNRRNKGEKSTFDRKMFSLKGKEYPAMNLENLNQG